MTTRHIHDLLPLWAGGDLPERETEEVRAHLADCPDCRAEAEAYRSAVAWLRTSAEEPFTAVERADLRRAVMDRIRPQPGHRTPRSARWLLPAAAALLLGISLVPWLRRAATLQAPTVARGMDPASTPAVAHAVAHAAAHAAAPGPAVVAARPRPSRPDFHLASREAAVSRIEFQTANPNIRIIWLARASAPDPTFN